MTTTEAPELRRRGARTAAAAATTRRSESTPRRRTWPGWKPPAIADRAYAADLSTRLIDVIKAFTAMKHRLYGAAHAEGYRLRPAGPAGQDRPDAGQRPGRAVVRRPLDRLRQVSGLVKAGLLDRQADPHDGRASILVVTDAGRAKIADLVALRGKMFAPLIADWADSRPGPDARPCSSASSTDLLAAHRHREDPFVRRTPRGHPPKENPMTAATAAPTQPQTASVSPTSRS